MRKSQIAVTPGRLAIESFLRGHATGELTLEIGCESDFNKGLFPNCISTNVVPHPSIDVQASVYQLPFPDETFPVVICTEVLEHLKYPRQALEELWRVLTPGGKLLLTTPFAYPIHDAPIDFFRFTRYGLEDLLNGWEVLELSETTSDAATLANFFHHWLFGKKGLLWKVPKLVWAGCWNLLLRSYARGGGVSNNNKRSMTSGYLVVARKIGSNGAG